MFSDPTTVTINAVPKTLNRTGTGIDQGSFATSDRSHRLSIAHSYGKRQSRVIKLTRDTLVASPLVAGQNVNQTESVHLVVNTPNGSDTAATKLLVDGFVALLAASSGAAITKLLAGES